VLLPGLGARLGRLPGFLASASARQVRRLGGIPLILGGQGESGEGAGCGGTITAHPTHRLDHLVNRDLQHTITHSLID